MHISLKPQSIKFKEVVNYMTNFEHELGSKYGKIFHMLISSETTVYCMTVIKAVLMYETCLNVFSLFVIQSLSLLKLSMNNLVRLIDIKGRHQVSSTSILMEVDLLDHSVFFAI